jgi:hypothetical protein
MAGRNSENFEPPATPIGATPYLLAAKCVRPDVGSSRTRDETSLSKRREFLVNKAVGIPTSNVPEESSTGTDMIFRSGLRVGRDGLREHLDRHEAIQANIARLVDLAHRAAAGERHDFVRPEASARCDSHRCCLEL